MRRLLVSILLGAVAAGGVPGALAQEQPDRQALLESLEGKMRAVRHMAFHPVIVRAVRSQNSEQLDMDLIQERDAEWRAAQQESGFQRAMLNSEASRVLRGFIERNPDFNEAFATDNQGANVAVYPLTSDYWQGDEDKWTRSFNNGNGRLHVGDVEVDDSTNTAAVQVSVPILDRGRTIGVLVIGIAQTYLEE